VGIALLAYRAWTAFDTRSEQLTNTQQIVDGTNALLSSIKDAETGQRGFLLTGEDRYLGPYRQALVDVPATLGALANAAAGRNPDQTQRIEALKPLVWNKLDELKTTIELRQSNRLDAALARVRSDRGQNLMDQIRRSCAEIQTVAYGRLAEYTAETRRSVNQMGLLSTFGSIGLFVLLLLSTVTIKRATEHRQQLIRELEESGAQTAQARDWLQTTIQCIGDGVIATDADGKVTILNTVAQSLTGWSQEEASGLPLEQVFIISNEETNAPVENPVRKALREGRIVGLANHTHLRAKDGRYIPIDDTAAPISDAQGKVIGVVLVFRDITQRREAERAEHKAVAEIGRHSELLERTNAELQQFAYAASHDLREPLRTITAYTQLIELRSGSSLDDQSAECLQFVLAAARRMGVLIDALLDYSKAGEVPAKPLQAVDMEAVLARAIGNLNGSIEANKAMVTHDPLPQIMGDETRLEQLIQNLIGNAIKYRRHDDPRIHVATRESEKEWLFSITDNGQGIPPHHRAQIFELFKRLHGQAYPGSGIGLATCKKIVEHYGGRIWVESEVGKGSTFFFTVPVASEFYRTVSG
jgi:PAS domain S-box-containing protein